MKLHNQYYWDGKKQRAQTAKTHTEEMARKYNNEIQESVKNTHIYTGKFWDACNHIAKYDGITISTKKADTVSALFQCNGSHGRVALLNFASYKFPGGGFMAGSRAQEESLCHESFLYNVLSKFDNTYYAENRKDVNRSLYRDRALYSPNIHFIRNNDVIACDVITCAAPNFSSAKNFCNVEYNNKILYERIRFILEIAKKEKVSTLILGAFGCGVFQQKPEIVAQHFIENINIVFGGEKINVIFAVIPSLPNQTDNSTPFINAVENWNQHHVT